MPIHVVSSLVLIPTVLLLVQLVAAVKVCRECNLVADRRQLPRGGFRPLIIVLCICRSKLLPLKRHRARNGSLFR